MTSTMDTKALVILFALAGCSRGESRITNTRLMDAPAPAAEPSAPLGIETVGLAAMTDPDADPLDWVECVGGQLEWEGRRVQACEGSERVWVDPDRDEVTLVVTAEGALVARARIAGSEVEAPFVDGRARLRVKLRPAMGTLSARLVSERTPLTIALEVEGQGVEARGEVRLETPRVMRLLRSALRNGLVWDGPVAKVAGPDTASMSDAILYIGPQPEQLPSNPDVPVAAIKYVAVDLGSPILALPCPVGDEIPPSVLRANRTYRPVDVVVYELASGQYLGNWLFETEPPRCGQTVTTSPRTVAHFVESILKHGNTEICRKPRSQDDPTPLLRLQRFLGLERGASAEKVAEVLGVLEPRGGSWLEVEGGAVAAWVTREGLEEVRVVGKAGVEILKSKRIADALPVAKPKTHRAARSESGEPAEPLLRMLDEPLAVAIKELGWPAYHGPEFWVWMVDQGPLTIFAELRCDSGGDMVCRELRVGSIKGRDPHDGGDVPGAAANPHSHRHPNDDGHGHSHDDHEHVHPDTRP